MFVLDIAVCVLYMSLCIYVMCTCTSISMVLFCYEGFILKLKTVVCVFMIWLPSPLVYTS